MNSTLFIFRAPTRPNICVPKWILKTSGFSLLELILVLAIMGIIGAALLPNFSAIQSRAKQTALNATLHTLQVSLSTYYLAEGHYPDRDLEIESLTATLQSNASLSHVPTNPYTGHPYRNNDLSGRILYHWDAGTDRYRLTAFGSQNSLVISEIEN